jgi:type IV pilus assembly protein PilY1
MNNSIPAAIRMIDFDGDSFGDRMYAADTGGRVWRFDIVIDADPSAAGVQQPTASQLVTGGVLASLGNADDSTHPIASTRRFYHSPDIALIQRRGTDTFFSISIGSGWRGHPVDTRIQDRFYSIRDYQPFTKSTQSEYDSRVAIVDSNLTDVTDINTGAVRVPATSPGWRLELRLPGGFRGEKILAESRTFNNVVLFPSYLPLEGTPGCGPMGGNRVYSVSVDDGQPVLDVNDDGVITETDRYRTLIQGGIAPEVSFIFPRPAPGDGSGDGGSGGGSAGAGSVPVCLSGLEVLPNVCQSVPVYKTFWRQQTQ